MKRYINYPVKTETMARLFQWSCGHVLGAYGQTVCYLVGRALSERALGSEHNDGQGMVDPALKYYWDGVAEVKRAMRSRAVRITRSQEFLEAIGQLS